MLGRGTWTGSSEMNTITQAYDNARNLALGRLRQEAQMVGAGAVIGVRLKRAEYEWGSDTLEYTAIGTAVHIEGAPPADEPALTTFSGEDFGSCFKRGMGPSASPPEVAFLPDGLGLDQHELLLGWRLGEQGVDRPDPRDHSGKGDRPEPPAPLRRPNGRRGHCRRDGGAAAARTRDRDAERNEANRHHLHVFDAGTAIAPLKHARPAVPSSMVMPLSGRGLSRQKAEDVLGE